jgi:SanA protein
MVQSLLAWLKAGAVLLFLLLSFIIACNAWVIYSTQAYIFRTVDKLPVREVGLVLGTSKKVVGGNENLFFRHRIEAAAQLYHQNKVRYLILSGDNSSQYYNEPSDMKAALLKKGVPGDAMTLDYAGHNTFASVLRVKKLFNQDSITIISQSFHSARALFISRHYKIPAIAFAARDVPLDYGVRTMLREYLARPKALMDIYLLNKDEVLFGEEGEAGL